MTHLSYELSKQLKNAGFPQQEYPVKSSEESRNKIVWPIKATNEDAYIPTLSELIEACKSIYDGHFNMGGFNSWWAIMRDKRNSMAIVPVQLGSTPEEAVAILWLTLNQK